MEIKMINNGDVSVVFVSGQLEMEKTKQFRQIAESAISNSKVIFSLDNLSFVGSSGIQIFFNTISELKTKHQKNCRIVGLKNDFKRILTFSQLEHLELFDNIDAASCWSPLAKTEILMDSMPNLVANGNIDDMNKIAEQVTQTPEEIRSSVPQE